MKSVVRKVRTKHSSIPIGISALLFFLIVQSASAQQGRHELPLDTVPIGGKEQQIEEDKMEAHDQLADELIALRDSISTTLSSTLENGISTTKRKSLQEKKSELDRVIKEFKTTERDHGLLQRGKIVMEEARRALKQEN